MRAVDGSASKRLGSGFRFASVARVRYTRIVQPDFLFDDVEGFRFRSWLWLRGYVLTSRIIDSVGDYDVELRVERRPGFAPGLLSFDLYRL